MRVPAPAGLLAAVLAAPTLLAQGRARDAGAPARRDAGVVARRDAGADVPVLLPPTHGRVDAGEARRLLATRNAEARRCYQQGVATDPALHGELVVRLRVEVDGQVSRTTLEGDPSLLRVGRCLEAALRTLRFPAPTGGPATVAAPYAFRPAE